MPARSAGESGATSKINSLSFGSVRKPSHPRFAGVSAGDFVIACFVVGAVAAALVVAPCLVVGGCFAGAVMGACLVVAPCLVVVGGCLASTGSSVGACLAGDAAFVVTGFFAGTYTGSCAWTVPASASAASAVSLSTIVLPPICGEAARAASRARPAPQGDRC